MKLKLKQIVTSILAGVMLLFSCVFVGCGEMPSGVFYTLKEAYENNYITRNDLLNIAYYSGDYKYNLEIYKNFQPSEKEELTEDMSLVLKKEIVKAINSVEENVSVEDFVIPEYYGVYNGAHCFYIYQKDPPDVYPNTEAVVYQAEIDGIVFKTRIEQIILWKEASNEN